MATEKQENLEALSNIFSAIEIGWSYLLDKAKGLPIGTTITNKFGPIASFFGAEAAVEKFKNSNQTSADLDQYLLDIGTNLPALCRFEQTQGVRVI